MILWKEIPGFERYEINNLGMVRDILKNKIIIGGFAEYPQVCLNDGNGNKKQIGIHLLVAELFVVNPKKMQRVDHVNELKFDPFYKNLRWVTPRQNSQHWFKNRPELKTSFQYMDGLKVGETAIIPHDNYYGVSCSIKKIAKEEDKFFKIIKGDEESITIKRIA